MNPKRITDFSNIYSTKNKSFMSNLPKTLNNTTRISPSPTFTSRGAASPSPRQNLNRSISPALYNFQQLNLARTHNKLRLGKQRIQKINYTLEVDAQSQKNYKKRLRQQELYIDYDYNPFSERFRKKKKREDKQKNQEKQHEPNLVQATMKNRTTKEKGYVQQLKKKIDKVQENAKTYLAVLQKEKRKKKYQQLKNAHQKYLSQQRQLQQRFVNTQKAGIDQLLDIVSIKEENYFKLKRDRQPFNIFELIHNPESKMFMTGREQLNQFYFSFDSMSNGSQTATNQLFLRDLSTYSRISVFNTSSKAIPPDHKIKEINRFFQDEAQVINATLYLVKGLIQPQILNSFFNGDMDIIRKNSGSQYKESQEGGENLVCFKENQKCIQTDWGGVNLQKAQLVYYKNEQLTQQQVTQAEITKRFLNQLKLLLKKQAYCLSTSIKDQRLMSIFEKERTTLICQQMDANLRNNTEKNEIQRKIRMSKVNKNRAEKLKTITIIDTFKEKKSMEKMFKKYTKKTKKEAKQNL